MYIKYDTGHYFNLDLSPRFRIRDSYPGHEFFIDFYGAGEAVFNTEKRRDKIIDAIENEIDIITLDDNGNAIPNWVDDDTIDDDTIDDIPLN